MEPRGFVSKFEENKAAYQKETLSQPLETLTLKRLLEEAIDQLLGLWVKINPLNKRKPVKSLLIRR
ncbi:MAG: hypothetical protein IPG32_16090 [Saprospirales bacterium]|nr:hypothetical protein [Saprospirales bacterium]